MPGSVSSTPAVRLSVDALPRLDTDLIVVPLFEGESTAEAAAALDDGTAGELRRAAEARELTGRPFEFFVTPLVAGGWRARRGALRGARPAPPPQTQRPPQLPP